MKVRTNTRVHLAYLCESLGAAEALDQDGSLLALAAFLRVRLSEVPKPLTLELGKRILGVNDLVGAVTRFVTANPEGGKRGQAFVAAAFDLVFEHVKTSRINDPGRHWPGDVVIMRGNSVTLTVEVKQRRATDAEIRLFVARAREYGIDRAAVATLDPSQPVLPIDDLRSDAWRRQDVLLSVLEDIPAVLHAALTWTGQPLDKALSAFPKMMAERLKELEVSPEGQLEWITQFGEAKR